MALTNKISYGWQAKKFMAPTFPFTAQVKKLDMEEEPIS